MPVLVEPKVLLYGMPALLILLFLGRLIVRRLRGRRAWLYSDEQLLEKPPWWVRTGAVVAIAAMVLGIFGGMVALARPQGSDIDVKTYEEKRSGCLVSDHSGSMATSLEEGSIFKVKIITTAQQRFVEKRRGDRLCIVPFTQEVLQEFVMPLTDDTAALTQRLEALSAVAQGGTEMGAGMFYALAMLIQDALPEDEELDLKLLLKEVNRGYVQTADKKTDSGEEGRPYVNNLLRRTGGLRHAYMVVSTDAETGTSVASHLGILEVGARLGMHIYVLGVGFDVTSYPDLTLLVRRTKGNVYFAQRTKDVDTLLEEINQLEKRKTLTRVVKQPRELASEVMAISIPLGIVGVLFHTLLIAGPAFVRLARSFVPRLAPKEGGVR